MTDEVPQAGHAKVTVRSDDEPAIVAWKEATMSELQKKGVHVTKEETAVGDSSGNGLAEHASWTARPKPGP